jgi:hypothetical protein
MNKYKNNLSGSVLNNCERSAPVSIASSGASVITRQMRIAHHFLRAVSPLTVSGKHHFLNRINNYTKKWEPYSSWSLSLIEMLLPTAPDLLLLSSRCPCRSFTVDTNLALQSQPYYGRHFVWNSWQQYRWILKRSLFYKYDCLPCCWIVYNGKNFTNISEVLDNWIMRATSRPRAALMMEVANTSENRWTSYQDTRLNNPETVLTHKPPWDTGISVCFMCIANFSHDCIFLWKWTEVSIHVVYCKIEDTTGRCNACRRTQHLWFLRNSFSNFGD